MADSEAQIEGFRLDYGREVEEEIAKLEELISQDEELSRRYSLRWLAIKLLEGDEEVVKRLGMKQG